MGFRQVLFCLIVLAVCAELVIGQGAGYEGRRRPRPRPRPPIGGGDGYEGRRPRPRPPVGEAGYEGRTRGHICPTPLCHCQGLGSTISYDHNGCEICTCNPRPIFPVHTPTPCPPGSRPVNRRPRTCRPFQTVSIWPTQNTCRRERGEFCSGGAADETGTCCVYSRIAAPQNEACPANNMLTVCAIRNDHCTSDFDCPNLQICCQVGCGNTCTSARGGSHRPHRPHRPNRPRRPRRNRRPRPLPRTWRS